MKSPKAILLIGCVVVLGTLLFLSWPRTSTPDPAADAEGIPSESEVPRMRLVEELGATPSIETPGNFPQDQSSDAHQLEGAVEQEAVTSTTDDGSEREAFERFTAYLANLRNKGMGAAGQTLTPEELQWLEDAKPYLKEALKDPWKFGEIQFTLIQDVLSLDDPQKAEAVWNAIQAAAAEASASGLLYSPDPSTESDEWRNARHELDRRATRQVQELLNDQERELFNRKFLGVLILDITPGRFDPTFQYVPPELGGFVLESSPE